ncbi:MAG: peptidoglycan-binding domain-containing protein [Bradyrhizobium sp.]|nr:peptidoglycan-binding domain-containing protein [Bradyrhizobium sp.]
MRVGILALSVMAILLGAPVGQDAAIAGPTLTPRAVTASADPATFTDEATRQTEARIGLDKRKRRDVQRRLTRLGFDTKVNGRFDEKTRAVILRWQATRDYPATGFLNAAQHQALLTESASSAQASVSDKASEARPVRRRGNARYHRNAGGPIAVIGGVVGGVVGGVFGRR